MKFQKLYAIPYILNNECVVEGELKFIDKDKQSEAFNDHPFLEIENPLQDGDKIIAVDGVPVAHSYELLGKLQEHYVNIVVERNPGELRKVSWKDADKDFDQEVEWKNMWKIAQSIGTHDVVRHSGDLFLLKPILPKMRSAFELSPEKKAWVTTELLEQKKEIESIEDPELRAQALHFLESKEKQLLLGLPQVQDRKVNYNPGPLRMFGDVFDEIWRTLLALVSGALNPKWISGPIGIVQVVQETWMISLKEALYWIGAISLNLGVINLLPIPVLDGGTILITFLEMVTRKRVSPKTLEKVVIPFAVLLIGLFIYISYNDISRIFGGLWRW